MIDVESFRQQIPVCQRAAYLNTGMSGPSPVPVVDAIKQRLDYEMEEGSGSPDVNSSGRSVREAARQCVASFLNASPEEICGGGLSGLWGSRAAGCARVMVHPVELMVLQAFVWVDFRASG